MEMSRAASDPGQEGSLPPHVQVALSPPLRDFHSHWCCCLGNCDSYGFIGCILGAFSPYIAIGSNLKAVTGNAFIGLVAGLIFLAIMVVIIVMLTMSRTCRAICSFSQSFHCKKEVYCERNPTLLWIAFGTYLILVLFGMCHRYLIRKNLEFASYREYTPGIICDDFWSWFCCFCGLCQETRTIMMNKDDRVRGRPELTQIPFAYPYCSGSPTPARP